jgi:hypothetical protein
MGGMPEVDARRRVSPTSPSGSRMAAQAAPCTRRDRGPQTLVGVLVGSLMVSLFGRLVAAVW